MWFAQGVPTPEPSHSSAKAQAERLVNDAAAQKGVDGPDWVMQLIVAATVLAVLWFIVKALAGKGFGPAVWLRIRLTPQIGALVAWGRSAPATVIYVSMWTATTIIVEGSPDSLVNALTRFNSTNAFGLITDPVRALVASALLVANQGTGFILYVIIFTMIVVRLEQKIGTARLIAVWIASHALASLIIVFVEVHGIRFGFAPKQLVLAADVGVSYVMVGSMGAYMLFVSKQWRIWYLLVMFVGIIVPMLFDFRIWDLGHFLATLIGFLTCLMVRRFGPVGPGLKWRELASSAERYEPTRVRITSP